jgi:hypothetical protein
VRLAVAVLAVLFIGCGRDAPAKIRIQNGSDVVFDSTIVVFPSGREFYGRLESGQSSDYRSVEEAYRYARIDAYFAGQHGIIQPIDFVGEEQLEEGRYTYRLSLSANAESDLNRIRLEFIEDP